MKLSEINNFMNLIILLKSSKKVEILNKYQIIALKINGFRKSLS